MCSAPHTATQIRSDQSLSRVRLFATPWITACHSDTLIKLLFSLTRHSRPTKWRTCSVHGSVTRVCWTLLSLKAHVGPLQCAKGTVCASLVLARICGNPKWSGGSLVFQSCSDNDRPSLWWMLCICVSWSQIKPSVEWFPFMNWAPQP